MTRLNRLMANLYGTTENPERTGFVLGLTRAYLCAPVLDISQYVDHASRRETIAHLQPVRRGKSSAKVKKAARAK